MQIQKRDQEILSSVFKYGLLSSGQIRELHFKNLHHTTLMRRLRILENEKLILRQDSLPNNQSAWSLGILGARMLKVDPPGRFTNRNTTLHDVTVSEIRMALEKVGLCQNFSSEMEMKRQIKVRLDEEKTPQQVPDGVFTAQAKGGEGHQVIAMEIELHAKNHQRYKRIVSQYLAKDSIQYIWYFVKSEGIARTIHEQWRALKKEKYSPIFLFSLVHQVKHDADKLQAWSTEKNQWLKMSDIFDLPRLNRNSENPAASRIGREEGASLGSQAA